LRFVSAWKSNRLSLSPGYFPVVNSAACFIEVGSLVTQKKFSTIISIAHPDEIRIGSIQTTPAPGLRGSTPHELTDRALVASFTLRMKVYSTPNFLVIRASTVLPIRAGNDHRVLVRIGANRRQVNVGLGKCATTTSCDLGVVNNN